MAASSWNDNGQKQFVHDPCKILLLFAYPRSFFSLSSNISLCPAHNLQMHFTDQIFFLAWGGCWRDRLGMSYHQSGQRHILIYVYQFQWLWFDASKTFLDKIYTYWDDWLRLKENHKGRQFVRPEVCRTYNFGEHVGTWDLRVSIVIVALVWLIILMSVEPAWSHHIWLFTSLWKMYYSSFVRHRRRQSGLRFPLIHITLSFCRGLVWDSFSVSIWNL